MNMFVLPPCFCRHVFNVDVDHSAYFPTTADTQKAIESDLLDIDLIVRLRELRHPGIDCRALESSYPESARVYTSEHQSPTWEQSAQINVPSEVPWTLQP